MKKAQGSPDRLYPDDTCWFYNIARNQWVSANFRGYHSAINPFDSQATVVFEGQNWTLPANEVFSTNPEEDLCLK